MVAKYRPDFDRIGSRDGWIGKGGYVHEFFGTVFWIFLAHICGSVGLGDGAMGAGARLGLALVITRGMFEGHFNAMVSMLNMVLGADPLDCLIRIVLQIAAGFMGFHLFYYLGYNTSTAWFTSSGISLIDLNVKGTHMFLVDNLWNWLRVFLTLCAYFFARSKLQIGYKWLDCVFLLAITCLLGGSTFAFAPNRVFFAHYSGYIKILCSFYWDYLCYAVCGFAARYLLNLYTGDDKLDWKLPEQEALNA